MVTEMIQVVKPKGIVAAYVGAGWRGVVVIVWQLEGG
jgi:hypothetical protein